MVKITDPVKKDKSPVIYLFISNNDTFNRENMKKGIAPQEKEFFKNKFDKLEKKQSFFYLHDINNVEWTSNKLFNPHETTMEGIHCCKKNLDGYKFVLNNKYFILYNEKTIHYYHL